VGTADRTLVVGIPREHDTLESPATEPRPVGLHPREPHPGSHGPTRSGSSAPPKRPKRKKSGWIALVVVLLLAVGAAFAGWWYGVGRFTSTPDVVTLSQDAAQAQIEDAGLEFKVGASAYSEKVPPGHVVSTDPGPGDDVERGGTVTATISKGPERHAVPNLQGKTESQATSAIRAASLTVADPVRRWSETVAKGKVISFTPKAGTSVKADTPVHLVVSKGPRPVTITDWTGKNADDAKTSLSQAGFDVTTTSEYNDDVDAGDVISQTPRDGTGHAGDEIKLVVSKGPHLVEVPDVDLYGIDDATAALEKAGFNVNVQENQPYFGLGYVVDQSPSANAMAPYQSTITVYVA
jgi:serine/threonine-protein kinase